VIDDVTLITGQIQRAEP